MEANLDTLEEFLEQIPAALQHWLDEHTDPEVWAEQWVQEDVQNAFRHMPVLGNTFFSFDWAAAAYKRLAQDQAGMYYRCPECGYLGDDSYLSCGCTVDSGPVSDTSDDIGAVAEMLKEFGACIPDYILYKALEEDGYPVYREGVNHIINPIIDECEEALARIADAESGAGMLAAIQAAMSIMHHSGNITEDHYGGASWGLLDNVRDDGFADTFGIDIVREYIEGR